MTTDDGSPVTEPDLDPPRSSGGRHRRAVVASRRPTAVLLLLLCVPAAVASIIFAVQTPSNSGATGSLLAANRESALRAARSSVQTILSYDYRTIDADIAKAKANTTGVFAHQYTSTASQLLSEARQVSAIVQATVGSAGVVNADGDVVVVLLFVDQASVRKTPGKATPTTRIDQSRVRVTMTEVKGRWLVSALAAL